MNNDAPPTRKPMESTYDATASHNKVMTSFVKSNAYEGILISMHFSLIKLRFFSIINTIIALKHSVIPVLDTNRCL
jgi:hypothetical protein